ncbi:MAG: RNA polymerase sigma factor [Candidatus Heteroscillospira sp.]|jgi:RNA polymerase sigma factor (sigma-70 family)
MEDRDIIDLYFARDEQAIRETDGKYGPLCRSLAMNILGVHEDAEECVSDGYHRVWTSIPPQRPVNFRAFLARIVRNLSISRWRSRTAEKRGGGRSDELVSELGECLVSNDGDPAAEMELRELTAAIDTWLSARKEADRIMFVRRYWYGEAVSEIERALDLRGCAQRLHRLRASLRGYLEKEGFFL